MFLLQKLLLASVILLAMNAVGSAETNPLPFTQNPIQGTDVQDINKIIAIASLASLSREDLSDSETKQEATKLIQTVLNSNNNDQLDVLKKAIAVNPALEDFFQKEFQHTNPSVTASILQEAEVLKRSPTNSQPIAKNKTSETTPAAAPVDSVALLNKDDQNSSASQLKQEVEQSLSQSIEPSANNNQTITQSTNDGDKASAPDLSQLGIGSTTTGLIIPNADNNLVVQNNDAGEKEAEPKENLKQIADQAFEDYKEINDKLKKLENDIEQNKQRLANKTDEVAKAQREYDEKMQLLAYDQENNSLKEEAQKAKEKLENNKKIIKELENTLDNQTAQLNNIRQSEANAWEKYRTAEYNSTFSELPNNTTTNVTSTNNQTLSESSPSDSPNSPEEPSDSNDTNNQEIAEFAQTLKKEQIDALTQEFNDPQTLAERKNEIVEELKSSGVSPITLTGESINADLQDADQSSFYTRILDQLTLYTKLLEELIRDTKSSGSSENTKPDEEAALSNNNATAEESSLPSESDLNQQTKDIQQQIEKVNQEIKDNQARKENSLNDDSPLAQQAQRNREEDDKKLRAKLAELEGQLAGLQKQQENTPVASNNSDSKETSSTSEPDLNQQIKDIQQQIEKVNQEIKDNQARKEASLNDGSPLAQQAQRNREEDDKKLRAKLAELKGQLAGLQKQQDASIFAATSQLLRDPNLTFDDILDPRIIEVQLRKIFKEKNISFDANTFQQALNFINHFLSDSTNKDTLQKIIINTAAQMAADGKFDKDGKKVTSIFLVLLSLEQIISERPFSTFLPTLKAAILNTIKEFQSSTQNVATAFFNDALNKAFQKASSEDRNKLRKRFAGNRSLIASFDNIEKEEATQVVKTLEEKNKRAKRALQIVTSPFGFTPLDFIFLTTEEAAACLTVAPN